jgi:hypothetical protein
MLRWWTKSCLVGRRWCVSAEHASFLQHRLFTSFMANDVGKVANQHSEICWLLVTVIHFSLMRSPYAQNVRRNTPRSFSVSSSWTHRMEPSPASSIEDENKWSYTFTPPIFLHDNNRSWRMVTHSYCHLLCIWLQTHQEAWQPHLFGATGFNATDSRRVKQCLLP